MNEIKPSPPEIPVDDKPKKKIAPPSSPVKKVKAILSPNAGKKVKFAPKEEPITLAENPLDLYSLFIHIQDEMNLIAQQIFFVYTINSE